VEQQFEPRIPGKQLHNHPIRPVVAQCCWEISRSLQALQLPRRLLRAFCVVTCRYPFLCRHHEKISIWLQFPTSRLPQPALLPFSLPSYSRFSVAIRLLAALLLHHHRSTVASKHLQRRPILCFSHYSHGEYVSSTYGHRGFYGFCGYEYLSASSHLSFLLSIFPLLCLVFLMI
jgi:hypothetical protein